MLSFVVLASLSVLRQPEAHAAQGDITTFAGGLGEGPSLKVALQPFGIAVSGPYLYVADNMWHVVRRLDTQSGYASVVVGNGLPGFDGDGGPATAAELDSPWGVAVDPSGDLVIADTDNHRVRRVDAVTGIITTIAGTGTAGFGGEGGLATAAELNRPTDVAVDAGGNVLIADTDNHRVRRIDTLTGIITTVAGNGVPGFTGDGAAATSAALALPHGLALDAAGNLLITDTNNNRIRRVDAGTGTISTVAGNGSAGFSGDGGPAVSAALSSPRGVAVDGAGNALIADANNYRVRRVDAITGVITTVAGNGVLGFSGDGGTATAATVGIVRTVAIDAAGDLLIGDVSNDRIRRVSAVTHTITTIAGSGEHAAGDGVPAEQAQLRFPSTVASDSSGNILIADRGNDRILRVHAASGIVSILAGTIYGFSGDGEPATAASLARPYGVALDASGNVLIADSNNQRVRRIDAATGIITTIAGTTQGYSGDGGLATAAQLYYPQAVGVDPSGGVVIADTGNYVIRRINPVTGVISTIAGDGTPGSGGDGGPATAAQLTVPLGVSLDAAGNIFIADEATHSVRRIDAITGIITTVAGTGVAGFSGDGGPATSAQLNEPWSVAIDASGNLLIADYGNHRVRQVEAATGVISTIAGTGAGGFAGDGGPATAADLHEPAGITIDAGGNVHIADSENHRIRRIAGTCGNGTLDAGEQCDDGASSPSCCTGACRIKPAWRVCRAPVSGCDLPESCDGSSATCPAETGFGFADSDTDSVCDGLDACTNVANGRTFESQPAPKVMFKQINVDPSSGNDQMKLRATFRLPAGVPFGTIDPLTRGVRLRVLNQNGAALMEITLPPGEYDSAQGRGWAGSATGSAWRYKDKSAAIGGIKTFKLQDKSAAAPGRVKLSLAAKNGTYPIVTGDKPITVIVTLGDPADAAIGLCAESAFTALDCAFDASQTVLQCKG